MKLSKSSLLSFLLITAIITACGAYSFTGASIQADVKTISIAKFFNDIGGGPPNIEQTFTNDLQDHFQRNTNLELVSKDGDLQFEGAIIRYGIRPQAIASSGDRTKADQSGLMRLTIAVQTTFTNTKKEEDSFKKTFSFYADYDPQATAITQIEDDLIEEIFRQIIQDIFLASVAQW